MKRRFACGFLVVAVLGLAARGYAQDKGVVKPAVPFAHAGLASVDRLKEAAGSLGLPLPLDVAQVIEAQFPFIGMGGVDRTKSLGIYYLASDELPQSALVVFAFPVMPDAATVAKLMTVGAEAVEGMADMVTMGGGKLAFKRTAEHLFMYPGNAIQIADMTDGMVNDDFKEKGVLATMDVDVKLGRAAAPNGWKKFLDVVHQNSHANERPASSDAQQAGRDAGENFVYGLIDNLEHLSVAIGLDEKAVHLTSHVRPGFKAEGRQFAKPKLPGNPMVTLDVVYPDAQSAGWIVNSMDGLAALVEQQSTVSAVEQADLRGVMKDLSTMLDADAMSIGIEVGGNEKVTMTLFTQYDRDVDVMTPLAHVLAIVKKEDLEKGKVSKEVVENFTAGDGSKGVRIYETETGHEMNIFISQSGRTATITASNDMTIKPAVVTLSATEKISHFATARMDLGEMLEVSKKNDETWQKLSEEERKNLMKTFPGKFAVVDVTGSKRDNGFDVRVDLPVEFVKALPMFAKAVGGGSAR